MAASLVVKQEGIRSPLTRPYSNSYPSLPHPIFTLFPLTFPTFPPVDDFVMVASSCRGKVSGSDINKINSDSGWLWAVGWKSVGGAEKGAKGGWACTIEHATFGQCLLFVIPDVVFTACRLHFDFYLLT